MVDNSDFVVSYDVIAAAKEAIDNLLPKHNNIVTNIKNASEMLIDSENWKGEARDEFKDTYRIVEHCLEFDNDSLSSISEILESFMKIYDELDIDSAGQLVDTVRAGFDKD